MYPDMYPVTRIIRRNHQISFSILFATSHFLLSASFYLRQSHPFTFWSVKLDRIIARFKCDVTLCIKRLTKILNGLKRTIELVCHECRRGGGVMCTGRCVGRSSLFGCWKDEGLNHPLIKAFCSLWDLNCHSGGYLKQDFIEGNRWDNGAQILRSISSQEPWLWWFKQENCTWLNVYRCVYLAHVCDGGEKERERDGKPLCVVLSYTYLCAIHLSYADNPGTDK